MLDNVIYTVGKFDGSSYYGGGSRKGVYTNPLNPLGTGLSCRRSIYSVDHLTETINDVVMMIDGMPSNWKITRLLRTYKGKSSILECNNYRGIKLMSHTMKLAGRLIAARLRDIQYRSEITNNQYGLTPGKSPTGPLFVLRTVQGKYK